MSSYIPFARPQIDANEIREVVKVLRSGWLTTGPRTAQFEHDFRSYVGSRRAQAVNSGTAALHLALAALGVGPGDEVITTPLTFCATVNTILHAGATPVLADTGPDGNIDPVSVAERITPRSRAILPVHLAGLPCEMHAIWALARRHSLFVVEDGAHAAGTLYRDAHVGSAQFEPGSDAVAFSFYATKNLTTGEGGMVTTNRDDLADRMRVLALHGISQDAWNRYAEHGNWYYQVLECGFKYNLSDIQSAIGVHQLRKLESFIEVRRNYARLYNEAFAGMEEIELPPEGRGCRNSWHLYMLRLNLEKLTITRDEFIRELRLKGIGASVHFIPIPMHPFFTSHASDPRNHCPRALELYARLVSLPLYPAMTPGEVDRVIDAVQEILFAARQTRSMAASAHA